MLVMVGGCFRWAGWPRWRRRVEATSVLSCWATGVIAIEATPDGQGYWLLAADGAIFTFGDAHFYGSTGNIRLNAPVVGMAATPNNGGYWIVAKDGGVFSFGDAHFYGSTGNIKLNQPVNGITVAPRAPATGWWPATAASSPLETRPSTVPWATTGSTSRSSA
jgi:hypothetical protein